LEGVDGSLDRERFQAERRSEVSDHKATRRTDISKILPEMSAGVFEAQINRALSDVAANVVTHGKKGDVLLGSFSP
jgi:hypothetical protein